MYRDFLQNLTAADLVLTPNRRLAAYFTAQDAQHHLSHQQAAWPSPDIVPWNAWLERCWYAAQSRQASPLLLLNSAQENALWEFPAAKQAWYLSHGWLIDPAVHEWAKNYKTTCETHHWLDHAVLPTHVTHLIQQKALPLPQRIFLVGFDEFTPQQQRLISALNEQGCVCECINYRHPKPHIIRLSAADTETEIQRMANWARQQLDNDMSSIGCIVPNLQEIYPLVDDIFSAHAIPFSMSTGRPINTFPLIKTALLILAFAVDKLNWEQLSLLLRSPYIGAATQELNTRIKLDTVLRAQNNYYLTAQQVMSLALKQDCLQLAQQLKILNQLQPTSIAMQLPSQWATLFSQQLIALGWPGDSVLNDSDQQRYELFTPLFSQLASLDIILNKISSLP